MPQTTAVHAGITMPIPYCTVLLYPNAVQPDIQNNSQKTISRKPQDRTMKSLHDKTVNILSDNISLAYLKGTAMSSTRDKRMTINCMGLSLNFRNVSDKGENLLADLLNGSQKDTNASEIAHWIPSEDSEEHFLFCHVQYFLIDPGNNREKQK